MELTLQQKENWNKVLQYMETQTKKTYNHAKFSLDENDCCVCSFIFLSGFYGADEMPSDGYPSSKGDKYHKELTRDFGADVFSEVFNYESEFYGWTIDETDYDLEDFLTTKDAAKLLREYLKVNNQVSEGKVVVTWTNRTAFTFASEASFREFMELNPDLKLKVKKIVKYRKVARTVYDDVEQRINL